MGQCIVVVEDETELLEMIRDVLELEEFKTVGVARPDLAPTVVGAVTPDLFLIDIMLPGMSGIELAQQLRREGHEGTPMIGMSASRLMTQMASDSGVFQDVIDKPFEITELLDCIGKQVAEAG